jgi:ABC-type transport system involved in cytochrome c biogenesis permease subunit
MTTNKLGTVKSENKEQKIKILVSGTIMYFHVPVLIVSPVCFTLMSRKTFM